MNKFSFTECEIDKPLDFNDNQTKNTSNLANILQNKDESEIFYKESVQFLK